MRILKNKIFRRILTLLLITAFLILMDNALGYVLAPVHYADYFRHTVSEAVASCSKTGMVFVGASRTNRTFVPRVFEEKLDMDCVINAGCAAQPITGTYFIVKDIVERLHPDQVVIGVTWNGLRSNGGLQSRLIAWDMLSLKNKLLMAVDCFNLSEASYISSAYRYKDNFRLFTLRNNLNAKLDLVRNNYEGKISGSEQYIHGYAYREGSIETGNVPLPYFGTFRPENLSPASVAYLDACIDLCKKNGVQVILVSGITSVARLYAMTNYQDAVDWYKAYADSKGIPYYNTNYLKGREEFLPDELMHDSNHVSGEGGIVISEVFADVLKKAAAGEDVSSCFYADLNEFKASVHRIVAVKAKFRKDPDNPGRYHVSCTSLQNEGVPVVYRSLYRVSEEEEYRLLRDWAPEAEMDLELSEHPACTVRIEAASAADETWAHAWQEYDVTPKKIIDRSEDNESE